MKPSICLSMIVKNERSVIGRCLNSVKPWVDRWCIVDTGSTDGTQDEIRRIMADLPGTFHERPWRDFGSNRSEALRLSGTASEYLFVIDADEWLEWPRGFAYAQLDGSAYSLEVRFDQLSYGRVCIVRSDMGWRYEGVLHEYLECDRPYVAERLSVPVVRVTTEGFRSRNPRKYLDDAAVLRTALIAQPSNARYRYYLAQSLRDAGDLVGAIEQYEMRAHQGGWEEEAWHAQYQAAALREAVGAPDADVTNGYLLAYQRRSTRAEPLVRLAAYLRRHERYALALMVMRQAQAVAYPSEDQLFVEQDAYGWRRDDEYGLALYYAGCRREAREAFESVLRARDLPHGERERATNNLAFCRTAPLDAYGTSLREGLPTWSWSAGRR